MKPDSVEREVGLEGVRRARRQIHPVTITWDREAELWVLEDGSTYPRLIDAENAVTRPKEKP